jgi:hypothetical protein
MTDPQVQDGTGSAGRLRGALLAVVTLGTLGLIVELLLLDHTETFAQWLPLAVLGGVLAGTLLVAVRPGPRSLRVFQVLMLAVFATGALGVVLHFRGNALFELEMNPRIGRGALVWASLEGAVPALAPGALAQLALVGLVFTWGHPGLRATRDGGRLP